MRIHPVPIAVLLTTGLSCAQQWHFVDGPYNGPYDVSQAIVWDARRGRVVAFGSEGETWEYEGATRLHRPTTLAPPARTGHVMVYDSALGEVVLFGGRNLNTLLNDTWLWDGRSWRQQVSVTAPSPRFESGFAYDSARNRVVLFGGGGQSGTNTVFSDTWEYDGAQWIQQSPATVPAAALFPNLAYDARRGVTVLVAENLTGSFALRVCEWNGNDWQQRTVLPGLTMTGTPRSLCYDPVRQRTVLLGRTQLWEWDGNALQLRLPSVPVNASGAGTYYDPVQAATVIAGGSQPSRTAIWTWDGTTFANLTPDRSPSLRLASSVFHDSVRGRTVLFGGSVWSAQENDETWEWDGLRWTQPSPAIRPPARQDAMVCFDPVRGVGLLYGGQNPNQGELGDFWQWDGTNWTQVPGVTPPARRGGAMAWDLVRGEAILCGGLAWPNSLGDTWRWNGSAWSQVNSPNAPSPPRSAAAMAFDPQRGRMVLFGGTNGSVSPTYLGDTWEWDGSQWHNVSTLPSPTTRPTGMIYDSALGRIVMASGSQMWTYDGITWSPLSSGSGYLAYDLRMVWDVARQRILLCDSTATREWTATPASADLFGSGCGAQVPLLGARTRPRSGENLFGLELATQPNLPVLFALGFGAGNTPVGNGCMLLVQQVVATTFLLPGASGLAVMPVPLPPNHALRGLVVHAQAAALDPASPGGLALSEGLRITVGD